MAQGVQREMIVEMLINSLEAERYVRGPLLESVIDELSRDARLSAAADAARGLLDRMDRIGHAEFHRTLREIRALVRDAAPRSGVVAARPAVTELAGAA